MFGPGLFCVPVLGPWMYVFDVYVLILGCCIVASTMCVGGQYVRVLGQGRVACLYMSWLTCTLLPHA